MLNICRFSFKPKIKGTMLRLNLVLVLPAIFAAITILFAENEPEPNIKTAGDGQRDDADGDGQYRDEGLAACTS